MKPREPSVRRVRKIVRNRGSIVANFKIPDVDTDLFHPLGMEQRMENERRALRYGSSLWGVVEGAVLESLSCNRGDLCRADASILAGSLAKGEETGNQFYCISVYLLTRVAYGCKFASLRYRGYDVGRIRSNVGGDAGGEPTSDMVKRTN